MSLADPNWPRWIFASMSRHFYLHAVANNLPIYIEGQDRQQVNNTSDRIEFRFDGPVANEVSKNLWNISATINILIVSYINEEDLHKIHRSTGIMQNAFTCIKIMRYGDGIDDDPLSEVGVMDHGEITIMQYGQVQASSRLLQATVESDYKMQIYTRN